MGGSRTRTAALAGLALGVAIGAARRRARTAAAEPLGGVLDGPAGRAVTVTVTDGVRIAVDVEDHPDPRFAVVFAHGWTMNLHCWHYQRAALAGEAMLVFYDQRGHGRSTSGPIETCTIDRLGDDLAEVIEAVVPEGLPIVLAGHSMGGMTIMALAARHPELVAARVAGVALLGTSAGELENTTFGLPGPMGRIAPKITPLVFDRLLARAAMVDANIAIKTRFNQPVMRYVAFGRRAVPAHVRFVTAMTAATPTEVTVGFYREFPLHDRLTALESLRDVETLIMVGEFDRLTPPVHSRRIARVLPDARLIILPDAGHMIGMERPDVVNRELRDLARRAVPAAR